MNRDIRFHDRLLEREGLLYYMSDNLEEEKHQRERERERST